MYRLLIALALLGGLTFLGCGPSGKADGPDKGKTTSGVEVKGSDGGGIKIKVPGADINVGGGKGVGVKAPGVDVNVGGGKGVGVKAPGADVNVGGGKGVGVKAPGVDVNVDKNGVDVKTKP